jgi:hypothetical protein
LLSTASVGVTSLVTQFIAGAVTFRVWLVNNIFLLRVK